MPRTMSLKIRASASAPAPARRRGRCPGGPPITSESSDDERRDDERDEQALPEERDGVEDRGDHLSAHREAALEQRSRPSRMA